MKNVLLPVDGSKSSLDATLYLIEFVKEHGPLLVHVVNVQPRPLLSQPDGTEQEATDQQFSTEAYSALKTTLHVLKEAHVEHRMHIRLGDTAEVLIQLADELGCDHIVMGTRGLGAISGILLGSVAHRILQLASIPVTCVKGES